MSVGSLVLKEESLEYSYFSIVATFNFFTENSQNSIHLLQTSQRTHFTTPQNIRYCDCFWLKLLAYSVCHTFRTSPSRFLHTGLTTCPSALPTCYLPALVPHQLVLVLSIMGKIMGKLSRSCLFKSPVGVPPCFITTSALCHIDNHMLNIIDLPLVYVWQV